MNDITVPAPSLVVHGMNNSNEPMRGARFDRLAFTVVFVVITGSESVSRRANAYRFFGRSSPGTPP